MGRPSGSSSRPLAVLLELTPDHGFTVVSQAAFLATRGFDVEILVSSRNRDLALLRQLPPTGARVVVLPGGPRGTITAFRRVARRRPAFVAINTPTGRALALFAAMLPVAPRLVIHNLDRRLDCRGRSGAIVERRAVNRAPRIYVLSDLLRDAVPDFLSGVGSDRVGVFFPSFFPAELDPVPPGDRVTAQADPVRVVIPGSVDPRRDYDALMKAFPAIKDSLGDGVVLHILGDATGPLGAKFVQEAARVEVLGSGVVVEPGGVVPVERFVDRMRRADFILPLLRGEAEGGKQYGATVASSSFMWARAFAVPLICSSATRLEPELADFVVTYRDQDVAAGLSAAQRLSHCEEFTTLRRKFVAAREGWFERSAEDYLR